MWLGITPPWFTWRGTVACCKACWTPDGIVWVQVLAMVTMSRSWAGHFTLTVPRSTLEYGYEVYEAELFNNNFAMNHSWRINNNYSMSPSWIWSDKITNERVARVGYNHFISNKGEWHNCFSKFANRVLPLIFISTILQSGKCLNLTHYFPYDVKLRILAHSRSFLANQKARKAIVGAENLLNLYIFWKCPVRPMYIFLPAHECTFISSFAYCYGLKFLRQ